MDLQYKIFETSKRMVSYDQEKHTMAFRIITTTPTFEGVMLDPKGMKLKQTKEGESKMPKLKYGHSNSVIPPGKWLKVYYVPQENQIEGIVWFDQKDPFGVFLEHKYATEQMTDCSAGILYSQSAVDLVDDIIIIKEFILSEISLVIDGAISDAMSLAECESLIFSSTSPNKQFFEEIKQRKLFIQKLTDIENTLDNHKKEIDYLKRKTEPSFSEKLRKELIKK